MRSLFHSKHTAANRPAQSSAPAPAATGSSSSGGSPSHHGHHHPPSQGHQLFPHPSSLQQSQQQQQQPVSPRPPISSPLPPAYASGSGRLGSFSGGSTIQLVPPQLESSSPPPPPAASEGLSASAASSAAELSAGLEHKHNLALAHDEQAYPYPAPSPASSASSRNNSSANNPLPASGSRKPVLNFLNASSSARHSSSAPQSPAEPPQSVLGRRISVRRSHHHNSPPPSQPYHQLPQRHPPPHSDDDDGYDPYLQRQPSSASRSRPQSMLVTPRENEVIDYSLSQRNLQQSSYSPIPQRKDSFANAAHLLQQQQYFEQQQQQQQQQLQQHPSDYRPRSQQDIVPVEELMPTPQHNQPRGSMDTTASQHGTMSREVSNLSQLQQQYSQRGLAHPNEQNSQGQGGGGGTNGGGGGGGSSGQQAYDQGHQQATIGRNTPDTQRADSRQGQPDTSVNLQQLMSEHETLQAKYRKVKNLYFEKNAEIERLQNTLAHQRLSQSRTSLDDNEYASRFERLDGAIKNVAFEIRQSWKTIPPWLGNVINAGAETKGGREMTVVGRASISRWVVDEILEQFFHPALEPNLSSHLKDIEHNIRRNSPLPQSIEEDDALSVRVCNWRLTTLDALHPVIHGPHALEARQKLAEQLIDRLVSQLQNHLHEPAPAGLLGGVQMIVDIAISLGANLPLESRDVRVWYPLPGERFDSKFMKSEGGLPALGQSTNSALAAQQPPSGGDPDKMDQGSDNSMETSDAASKDDKSSNAPAARAGVAGLPHHQSSSNAAGGKDKKSMGLGNKFKKALQGTTGVGTTQQQQGSSGQSSSKGGQSSIPTAEARDGAPRGDSAQGKDAGPEKVRVAGFMAVEVRGRSILVKAPVWL